MVSLSLVLVMHCKCFSALINSQGVPGSVGPEGLAGEPGRPGTPGPPGVGKPGPPVGRFII